MAGDLEAGAFGVCFDIVGNQFVSRWEVHKLPEVEAELLRVRGYGIPGDIDRISLSKGKVDTIGIFGWFRIGEADSVGQRGRDCEDCCKKKTEYGARHDSMLEECRLSD